jgi:TolA-binding protein
MKRTERHHLKENELARLAMSAREGFGARGKQVVALALGALLLAVALLGYFAWRSRAEASANQLLAEAMVTEGVRVGPPAAPDTPSQGPSFATEREKREALLAKLMLVIEQYPSSEASLYARSRAAATLLALDRFSEAAAMYRQVAERAGDGLYGQMAQLGVAEAQVRAGEYEPAITTFRELSQRTDSALPVDGILMQLGRAYLGAGQRAEAEQTFTRLVDEFPNSPFTEDARRELATLAKG